MKLLPRTRFSYWSHSWVAKLTAKWLGAPPCPTSATMEEWNEFDKNQKTNFALQEHIEDFLGGLQNVLMFPHDVYYTIRCYFHNRFRNQMHVLHTDLEPGQYYDYDTRLLHGMFESFAEFIEIEQTLDNLKWELTLTNDFEWLPKDKAALQPEFGMPSPQAVAAVEKMALYTWWRVTRPARVDSYEASGFATWSAEQKNDDDNVFSLFVDDGDEVKKETRAALSKKWHEIDDQHDKEDEDMMIRLIHIRRSCWT